MKEKRKFPRYKVWCEIKVASDLIIEGILVDFSSSGILIKLTDKMKSSDFFRSHIGKFDSLEFKFESEAPVTHKVKLVRVEEKENLIQLGYEFLQEINLPNFEDNLLSKIWISYIL